MNECIQPPEVMMMSPSPSNHHVACCKPSQVNKPCLNHHVRGRHDMCHVISPPTLLCSSSPENDGTINAGVFVNQISPDLQ